MAKRRLEDLYDDLGVFMFQQQLPQPFGGNNQGINQFGGGLSQLLSGIFGGTGKAQQKAFDEYNKYQQQALGAQQPYNQAGMRGMKQYESMLGNMQDPGKFLNNLTGQYQESPYQKYLQQNALNASNNAASASGMMGSSPLSQFNMQQVGNIANSGIQDWLKQALGINSEALGGYQHLTDVGQKAANNISDIYGNLGNAAGGNAYNQQMAGQNQWSNILGGLGGMGLSFFL